ncbi:MAG: histidine kinase, partial [Candidatus Promineifilaceae bacterium]
CSRLKALVDGTDGLRYHASIPLYANQKKLGVMNVASPGWRQLSAEELRLLHIIGDMLSIAIERARLFDKSAQFGAVEERNRLAREIHDTLAQGMSALALQLETAEAMLETGAENQQVQGVLRQSLALARANLDEARRSVLDLRAAPLEGKTLAEALTDLAEEISSRDRLPIRLEVAGAERPLPARVEAGVYRMAQEALANVVRHAAARQAVLSLSVRPEQIEMQVADDGRGFEPAQDSAGRYGLIGLNERAKLLGGRLHLESAPGQGTRVHVVIPLAGGWK